MNLVTNFKVSISSNDSGTVNVELFAEINYWNTILSYWLENCTSYEPKYGIGIPLDIDCCEDWPSYPLVGFYDENDMKAFPKKGKTIRARELYSNDKNISFLKRIHNYKHNNNINKENIHKIMNSIDNSFIMNTKEMKSFNMIKNMDELPKDNFNTICNTIIHNMEMNSQQLSFVKFRDDLYDILVYNLDVVECIWHVLHYFIHHNKIAKDGIHSILDKMHLFLKHYNNNYRPIYHLENIFYYIITKIQTEPLV